MVSAFLRVLKLVDACLDIKVQIKSPQIITERPGVVAPLPQGHAHILLPPLIAKCHKKCVCCLSPPHLSAKRSLGPLLSRFALCALCDWWFFHTQNTFVYIF